MLATGSFAHYARVLRESYMQGIPQLSLAHAGSEAIMGLNIGRFLKYFLRTHTHVLFWGPLVPLFWISGDVSSGFQSHSGFCLIHFCRGECNVYSLRSTSSAIHCQPLDSWHGCQLLPYMHQQRRELARGQVGNIGKLTCSPHYYEPPANLQGSKG